MTEGLALFSQNNERRAHGWRILSSVGVGQAKWGKSGFHGVMQEEAKWNTHEHHEKGDTVKVSCWLYPLITLLCCITSLKTTKKADNITIWESVWLSSAAKFAVVLDYSGTKAAQSDLEGSTLTRPSQWTTLIGLPADLHVSGWPAIHQRLPSLQLRKLRVPRRDLLLAVFPNSSSTFTLKWSNTYKY